MHDDEFLATTTERLTALPRVQAVTLGGSRAVNERCETALAQAGVEVSRG